MGKVSGDSSKFPSLNIDVDVGDSFVNSVELSDVCCPSSVNEECDSSCVGVVSGPGKDVVPIGRGPNFLLCRSPCFVESDDVPWPVLDFDQ